MASMKLNIPLLTVLMVPMLSWLPSESLAELSPYVYIDAANQAPEALLILVHDVKQKSQGASTIIELQGEVLQVRRSSSGLLPGNLLRIVYGATKYPSGWVGPSQAPILVKDTVVSAFLESVRNEPGTYQLAARGQSFSSWVWEQSDHDVETALTVKFDVDAPHGCDVMPPEIEAGRVTRNWIGDDRLHVTAWVMVDSASEFSGGEVALAGDEVRLIYKVKQPFRDDRPIPICRLALQLNFEIDGLAKDEYRVKVYPWRQ